MTVVGATMAFRTSLLDWVLPLPSELEGTDHLYLHDGWIAVLAAVRGRIAVEPRRLMQYRQHRDQTTQMSLLNSPDLTTRHVADPDQQLLRDQRRVRLVADRIRERCISDDCGANSAELFRRDEFLSNRVMVRATAPTHRLGAVLRDLVGGNYRSYARGVRTAMRDLTAPTLQIRPSR
jgi:hypothetical protein